MRWLLKFYNILKVFVCAASNAPSPLTPGGYDSTQDDATVIFYALAP